MDPNQTCHIIVYCGLQNLHTFIVKNKCQSQCQKGHVIFSHDFHFPFNMKPCAILNIISTQDGSNSISPT